MAEPGPPAGDDDAGTMDPELRRLGTEALHARMRDDTAGANLACVQILGQFGLEGIWEVMLGWTDTAIKYVYGSVTGEQIEIAFEAQDKAGRPVGEMHQNVEAVPYGARFAGRFIVARHNDDQAMAEMLIDTAISDGRAGDAVIGLLGTVAYGLRAVQAGRQLVIPNPWRRK